MTVIEAGPCVVTQNKTAKKDGYEGVQVGFGRGSAEAADQAWEREPPGRQDEACRRSATCRRSAGAHGQPAGRRSSAVDDLRRGDMVNVTGTSKGKGFAGVVKR